MTRDRPNPVTLAAILDPGRNSFGLLRLLMAVAVLISHSFYFVTGTPTAEPLYSLTGHSLGEHAVQVFFFLSGILVTQSFARSRSVVDFAVARALRIFPGLAVCVLWTALVLGPLVSTLPVSSYFADPALPRYLTRTLLLTTGSATLPDMFTALPASSVVNMSLWTLKYEVLCYALLALFCATGLLTGQSKGLATAALALGVAVIFIQTPKPIEATTPFDTMRYFALYFGMGVLAFHLRERLVIRGAAVIALLALFALAIGSRFGELACALFVGYATIYAGAFRVGRFAQSTDLSFGIYIYAAPVQQTLLEAFPQLDAVTLSAAALTLTSGLALASWIAIEQPAMTQRHAVAQIVRRLLALQPVHAIRWQTASLDRILALKRSHTAHI
jgi:peptidoglycan/LPS O-acetylase OafA/YrhL